MAVRREETNGSRHKDISLGTGVAEPARLKNHVSNGGAKQPSECCRLLVLGPVHRNRPKWYR